MIDERTKESARSKAIYARKKGRLVQQPCERCGEVKSVMHHDDYLKPLDVRWLCAPCHVRYHDEVRNPRFYERLARLGQTLEWDAQRRRMKVVYVSSQHQKLTT